MSEDIHEWVKQRLNEGEDSNALRERLSAHSYDPSIVDEVMSSTSSTNTENKKENVKELKGNNFDIINTIKEVIKPDKSKIILTLVLVIFYTIFIYQLFQFQDTLSSDVIDNINQIKKNLPEGDEYKEPIDINKHDAMNKELKTRFLGQFIIICIPVIYLLSAVIIYIKRKLISIVEDITISWHLHAWLSKTIVFKMDKCLHHILKNRFTIFRIQRIEDSPG